MKEAPGQTDPLAEILKYQEQLEPIVAKYERASRDEIINALARKTSNLESSYLSLILALMEENQQD